MKDFIKEHNVSITIRKDLDDNVLIKNIIQENDFSTDESNSEEEVVKEESFEEREIIPYTELLPEMPDEEISKEIFIDENSNGVGNYGIKEWVI